MVLHKSKAVHVGIGEWTMCGKFIKYFHGRPNIRMGWAYVTCKNCLKRRK